MNKLCQQETTTEPLMTLERRIDCVNGYFTNATLNQNEDEKEIITERKKRGSYKKWAVDEIEWLKNNYPVKGRKYCMEYLQCSLDVLKSKLKKLRLKYVGIVPSNPNNKICTKCKKEKSIINDFYLRGNGKVRCSCKLCTGDLYRNNVEIKLANICRKRVSQVIKNNPKSEKTFELVGCSPKELKEHLEKQFRKGMSWKNYGKSWQMDHIVPCCQFDLSKMEEQKKCFNFTNIRPLWKTTQIAIKFGDTNTIGNLNRNKFNL